MERMTMDEYMYHGSYGSIREMLSSHRIEIDSDDETLREIADAIFTELIQFHSTKVIVDDMDSATDVLNWIIDTIRSIS